MRYLVSHQGQESGPFTLDEIVGQLRAKKLELFDYIYNEAANDWVLLLEHEPVVQMLKSNKPIRAPEVKAAKEPSEHAIVEWFVRKGENRFGPFSYVDVLRMLQQKIVFPFDFIWHAGMEDWRRVVQLTEFSESTIRSLLQEDGMEGVFVKRQFKRHEFNARVIIHDNFKLWTGQGFEISQGGVGVRLSNALIVPGQQVSAHFSDKDNWPAFNAFCEVVSHKIGTPETSSEYGLRFVSMSQDVQDELRKRVA
jgi:hypothetical protein